MNTPPVSQDPEPDPASPAPQKSGPMPLGPLNKFFANLIAAELLVLLLHGIFAGHSPGVALLWAFACMAVGAAVGFLFGLTKIQQPSGGNQSSGATAQQPGSSYNPQINTN